jgi:hypothetical protein
VTLINTDGMSFIGPGSEWFWTALSGIVLAVTFLAIYRQLAMARSAGARDQLGAFTREWNSERMLRHRLALLVAARDEPGRADLPEGSALAVGDFWEGVAALARAGHQDDETLLNVMGPMCQSYWGILSPWVRQIQAETGVSVLGDLEWLASLAAEGDRRRGAPVITTEMTASRLPVWITRLQDMIQVEESLRTVMVATPQTLLELPATTAAGAQA